MEESDLRREARLLRYRSIVRRLLRHAEPAYGGVSSPIAQMTNLSSLTNMSHVPPHMFPTGMKVDDPKTYSLNRFSQQRMKDLIGEEINVSTLLNIMGLPEESVKLKDGEQLLREIFEMEGRGKSISEIIEHFMQPCTETGSSLCVPQSISSVADEFKQKFLREVDTRITKDNLYYYLWPFMYAAQSEKMYVGTTPKERFEDVYFTLGMELKDTYLQFIDEEGFKDHIAKQFEPSGIIPEKLRNVIDTYVGEKGIWGGGLLSGGISALTQAGTVNLAIRNHRLLPSNTLTRGVNAFSKMSLPIAISALAYSFVFDGSPEIYAYSNKAEDLYAALQTMRAKSEPLEALMNLMKEDFKPGRVANKDDNQRKILLDKYISENAMEIAFEIIKQQEIEPRARLVKERIDTMNKRPVNSETFNAVTNTYFKYVGPKVDEIYRNNGVNAEVMNSVFPILLKLTPKLLLREGVKEFSEEEKRVAAAAEVNATGNITNELGIDEDAQKEMKQSQMEDLKARFAFLLDTVTSSEIESIMKDVQKYFADYKTEDITLAIRLFNQVCHEAREEHDNAPPPEPPPLPPSPPPSPPPPGPSPQPVENIFITIINNFTTVNIANTTNTYLSKTIQDLPSWVALLPTGAIVVIALAIMIWRKIQKQEDRLDRFERTTNTELDRIEGGLRQDLAVKFAEQQANIDRLQVLSQLSMDDVKESIRIIDEDVSKLNMSLKQSRNSLSQGIMLINTKFEKQIQQQKEALQAFGSLVNMRLESLSSLVNQTLPEHQALHKTAANQIKTISELVQQIKIDFDAKVSKDKEELNKTIDRLNNIEEVGDLTMEAVLEEVEVNKKRFTEFENFIKEYDKKIKGIELDADTLDIRMNLQDERLNEVQNTAETLEARMDEVQDAVEVLQVHSLMLVVMKAYYAKLLNVEYQVRKRMKEEELNEFLPTYLSALHKQKELAADYEKIYARQTSMNEEFKALSYVNEEDGSFRFTTDETFEYETNMQTLLSIPEYGFKKFDEFFRNVAPDLFKTVIEIIDEFQETESQNLLLSAIPNIFRTPRRKVPERVGRDKIKELEKEIKRTQQERERRKEEIMERVRFIDSDKDEDIEKRVARRMVAAEAREEALFEANARRRQIRDQEIKKTKERLEKQKETVEKRLGQNIAEGMMEEALKN